MLEKLWNDIKLIYDGFNFSSRLLIDDLMIVSQDNHYLLYYKQDDEAKQYYEFIHKFITYIIYNGNKLYALDYVYEYGGKEDNFFSLRKILCNLYIKKNI